MNRNKLFKKIFVFAIILSLLYSAPKYSRSGQDLDDLAYVMAIGVDVGTNAKYKISLQLSTLESSATEAATKSSDSSSSSSSGSSSPGSDTSSNYIINTVETDSLDSAINISNAFVNKDINLSHCKILVLSEDIAKNGVGDIVNALINKVEVRPDCNIIISKVPVGEFTSESKPEIGDILSKYYDVTANTYTGSGYSETVKLSNFYSNLNDSFYQAFATLGIMSNPSSNTIKDNDKNQLQSNLDIQARSLTITPKESAVETIGLAVFNEDVLVGTLSANETACHQLVTNNFNYFTLNMPSPFSSDETLDLYISAFSQPKIKVSIVNNSPFVECNLYLDARMLSFNSDTINTLTEDKLNTIKTATVQYIEKQVYNYFDKTSKEFNSDIGGIGRFAAKNFKTIEEWESYNWLENYKNCTFKVNATVAIKSGHLLTNE